MRTTLWLLLGLLLIGILPASAALPAGEIWRENLLNYRVGYGRNVTGGAGGTLCTVTSLAENGANTLKDCVSRSGPQWVIFGVSGTITLTAPLLIYPPTNGSNKTIDGRGQTIDIVGNTINLSSATNIIIHNISIHDTGGDAIRMQGGSTNLWFDHITCHTSGPVGEEECFDVGSVGGYTGNDPTTNLTLSWLKFIPPQGSGPILTGNIDQTWVANGTMTIHHNWYAQTAVRHPYAWWMKIHSFNNYCDKNNICAQTSQGVKYYSENDVFENPTAAAAYPRIANINTFGTPPQGPTNVKRIGAYSVTGFESYDAEISPGTIFDPATEYGGSYASFLDVANAALITKITNATTGAGRVPNPYNSIGAATPELVASYAFENVLTDASGKTNTLTGVGSPTFTTGHTGQALTLNGTSQYATAADAVSLDLSTGMTLAAWVRLNTPVTTYTAVLAKQYVYFLYAGSTGLCGTGAVVAGFYDSGSVLRTVCFATPLAATTWTHLATTYDGTTLRLYLGGTQVATTAIAGTILASANPLYVGATGFGEFFPGLLDEVFVYNYALTPTEVLALASTTGPASAPQVRIIH